MNLSPTTRATLLEAAGYKLIEAARLFEAARDAELAHDADQMARTAFREAELINATEADKIARSEAESAEWEAIHYPSCRDMIGAAEAHAERTA